MGLGDVGIRGNIWIYLIPKQMIKKYWPLVSLALVLPALVSAQTDKFGTFLGFVKGWVDKLIPIFIGVALLYFIWNAITLIRSEDESKREEAKMGMWWAIIAMFVIVSIWGITEFIGISLGVGTSEITPDFPKI